MITKIYNIFKDIILKLSETSKSIFDKLSTPLKYLIDDSIVLEDWAQQILNAIVESAVGDATILDLLFGLGLGLLIAMTGILFIRRLFK